MTELSLFATNEYGEGWGWDDDLVVNERVHRSPESPTSRDIAGIGRAKTLPLIHGTHGKPGRAPGQVNADGTDRKRQNLTAEGGGATRAWPATWRRDIAGIGRAKTLPLIHGTHGKPGRAPGQVNADDTDRRRLPKLP